MIVKNKIKYVLSLKKISFFLFCIFVYSSILFAGTDNKPKNEFYRGDAVRISVIEVVKRSDRQSISIDGDYTIDKAGYIMLPVIGRIKVVGHDRFSLTKQIKELYSPYFKDPFITITPLIRLTLMGAFNQPGSYRISPESSLWELIAMAGGPKESCDLTTIRVERGGAIEMENLLEHFEKGYSLDDIGIKSGDQIISKEISNFGISDVMSYTTFIMSMLSLYFTINNNR